jgi:hypothetical protein
MKLFKKLVLSISVFAITWMIASALMKPIVNPAELIVKSKSEFGSVNTSTLRFTTFYRVVLRTQTDPQYTKEISVKKSEYKDYEVGDVYYFYEEEEMKSYVLFSIFIVIVINSVFNVIFYNLEEIKSNTVSD